MGSQRVGHDWVTSLHFTLASEPPGKPNSCCQVPLDSAQLKAQEHLSTGAQQQRPAFKSCSLEKVAGRARSDHLNGTEQRACQAEGQGRERIWLAPESTWRRECERNGVVPSELWARRRGTAVAKSPVSVAAAKSETWSSWDCVGGMRSTWRRC